MRGLALWTLSPAPGPRHSPAPLWSPGGWWNHPEAGRGLLACVPSQMDPTADSGQTGSECFRHVHGSGDIQSPSPSLFLCKRLARELKTV